MSTVQELGDWIKGLPWWAGLLLILIGGIVGYVGLDLARGGNGQDQASGKGFSAPGWLIVLLVGVILAVAGVVALVSTPENSADDGDESSESIGNDDGGRDAASDAEDAGSDEVVRPGDPVVVLLSGESGLYQRGFFTPTGLIVTPTQVSFADEIPVRWRVDGVEFEAQARLLSVGEANPELSLLELVSGDGAPLVDFAMSNGSALRNGDPVTGWLSPTTSTTGTVTDQRTLSLEVDPLFAGQDIGERLNEFERSSVLCFRGAQNTVGLDDLCQGVAETFAGEVLEEFVGLASDPTEQVNAALALIAGSVYDATEQALVTTDTSTALAAATAAVQLGFDDLIIVSYGDTTGEVAQLVTAGDIDLLVPQRSDSGLIEFTPIASATDIGIPVRDGDERVVAIVLSRTASATFGLPIEAARDNFPESF